MNNFWQKNARVLAASLFINFVVIGGLVVILGAGLGFSSLPSGKTFLSESVDLTTLESAIVSVVEQAEPAVVSIVVTKDVPKVEQYFEDFNPFGGPSPFGGFEFRIPRLRENGTERREIGGGTGFIVSSDGLVLSNKHVVADEDASYTILTNDNQKMEAEVVARDPSLDIAVLKIKGSNLPYLSFGDSDQLKPGRFVIAIGNALGEFRNSVSVGVISGLFRSIVAGDGRGQSELLEEVIQTDAAINPGNSGGPLLDLSGRVVGVNVAVATGSENIGFALPSNLVSEVVESVKEHGEIVRPYIGVRYVLITPSLKEKNNLPFDYGALISRDETEEGLAVMPGSPADKAGLVENDIILEVDGARVSTERSLASLIRQKKVGDRVRLKIWHKGEVGETALTLEKLPAP